MLMYTSSLVRKGLGRGLLQTQALPMVINGALVGLVAQTCSFDEVHGACHTAELPGSTGKISNNMFSGSYITTALWQLCLCVVYMHCLIFKLSLYRCLSLMQISHKQSVVYILCHSQCRVSFMCVIV